MHSELNTSVTLISHKCSTYAKSFVFLSSGQHNLSCVVLTANGGPMLPAESVILTSTTWT